MRPRIHVKELFADYLKVESLPKKNKDSYWEYALDVLVEHEFDAETIGWLKSRPVVKDFPPQLFEIAVKRWRRYLESESWDEMEPNDKPRAFEYRHALYLLDYPDRYTFKTLETHYYKGKKLSENQT